MSEKSSEDPGSQGPGSQGPGATTEDKEPPKSRAIDKDAIDIQPLVYSFRVSRNPSPGSVMNAMLPPYWLYHDHAFGVIWMLFHTDKKYIGISQLHWCLRFLLDLKNTDGEYTGDVNVCIQAVQDDLIEQYANLGTALESQEEADKDKEIKDKEPEKTSSKADDVASAKADDAASAAAPDGAADKSEEGKDVGDVATATDGDNTDSGAWSTLPVTSTPKRPPRETDMCLESSESVDENLHANTLSFTYNEMASRGPAPYTEQTPLEQIFMSSGGPGFSAATPEIAAKLTNDVAPPSVPLAEMGTEELVGFLNSSRQEHVERIKKEIERLYGLEKFMENVDKQSFSAYITDDLAKRLDKLDGQDIVKGVEGMIK